MANDFRESEGSTLAVSATLPTPATPGADITDTEYAALTYTPVTFLEDLPTADSSRTTTRIPTVDRGEITVPGTTARAEMAINLVASKGDAGQTIVKAAEKSGDPLACRITFSDGVIQYFTVDVNTAARSAPIGRANQLSTLLSVRGEVVEVVA